MIKSNSTKKSPSPEGFVAVFCQAFKEELTRTLLTYTPSI
jgi:hypothetical protein